MVHVMALPFLAALLLLLLELLFLAVSHQRFELLMGVLHQRASLLAPVLRAERCVVMHRLHLLLLVLQNGAHLLLLVRGKVQRFRKALQLPVRAVVPAVMVSRHRPFGGRLRGGSGRVRWRHGGLSQRCGWYA